MTVQIIKARKARLQTAVGEETPKLKVAAYCRVSTDMKEQESSYEAQCTHYTNFIQSNPEWKFAGIYADEGISGTSTKRRERFNRMILDCEAGKIDLVVTKSISRFARNTLDCLKYIRKLKALGIAVFFEKESINTLDAKGEVLITIMASIAQQESQSISQNVRLGIQYRMQQGKGRLNTSNFMGLTKENGSDSLVIVPEEAGIVRRIFREYLEGYSPAMIGRHLEAAGIPTPAGGTVWYQSTIVSILENEKYSGDLLLQKYYTTDFLTHKIVKNTGQLPQYYVENAHEPIVPKQVYYQVQGELMRRGTLKNDPTKLRFGSVIALSGRLICGKCGRTLKRYRKPDENATDWRCRKRAYTKRTNNKEIQGICGCRIVKETDAKRAVVESFNRLSEYRDQLIRTQAQIRKGEIRRIDALIESLKEQEYHLQERQQLLEEDELKNRQSGKKVPEEAFEKTQEEGGLNLEPVGEKLQDEQTFLEKEILRLQEKRNGLILERAEHANREIHVRLLLELVERMRANREDQLEHMIHKIAAADSPIDSPACSDYDEFFLRTQYELPEGILSQTGEITAFDNEMVIRYLRSVTVYDDCYEVAFKAGIRIKIKTAVL